VNVVTRVEFLANVCWIVLVSYSSIKINYGIEFPTGPDPLVQFLSCGFTHRAREPYTLFGHDCCADDFDMVHMRPSNDFSVAFDQVLCNQGVWTCDLAVEVYVVDAFQQDDPAYTWFAEDIAVKPCQSADSRTISKNLIA